VRGVATLARGHDGRGEIADSWLTQSALSVPIVAPHSSEKKAGRVDARGALAYADDYL
jgi:hypothetical protein